MSIECNEYKRKLRGKMDELVHFVYAATKKFPKDEMYGATSQLRRAILSVILNYIEGYSRFRTKTSLLFFEISFW